MLAGAGTPSGVSRAFQFEIFLSSGTMTLFSIYSMRLNFLSAFIKSIEENGVAPRQTEPSPLCLIAFPARSLTGLVVTRLSASIQRR